MVAAGCTRVSSLCGIDNPDVIAAAKAAGGTRAACAMRVLAEHIQGGIVAIGNAPTAIWSLLRLHAETGLQPALVIGLPVGFVGASESKQALWESGLPCITNVGPRGGSPWAAAAVNHLCRVAAG
ncbi:MAG: precorrin-8X methylmutase, partial [Planctomycetota bacterium]